METTIRGTTKEIVDLVMELQSQRGIDSRNTVELANEIYDRVLATAITKQQAIR